MTYDLLIVGAGLTGLTLAHRMREAKPNWSLKVVDKGISAGGRIASRRLGSDTFDHGVQYIPDDPFAQEFIDYWKSQTEVSVLTQGSHEGCFSPLGMTALAKAIAKNLDVEFRSKVVSLKQVEGKWSVVFESGQTVIAKRVVLTCPLPQSLDVLDQSNIKYSRDLRNVSYAKTIVLMLQTGEGSDGLSSNLDDFEEFSVGVYPQHNKRHLSLPGWSVEMSPSWSETHFDLPDSQILEHALKVLREKSPGLKVVSSSIKKWRFATPVNSSVLKEILFDEPSQSLYLAGDAFGLTGVMGSFQSSRRLVELLSSDVLTQ